MSQGVTINWPPGEVVPAPIVIGVALCVTGILAYASGGFGILGLVVFLLLSIVGIVFGVVRRFT